ncbi:hypothetical protein FDC35_03795 [Clostridium botulinum]|nr:hypothetical protein [Clostridium botulinum]NFP00035.1 hypothetical protein [Clostridium botulinum]
MVEHKTVINKEGYIVERCVRIENGLIDFVMKEGYTAVDLCRKNLVKGKYEKGEWMETATEEEKEDWEESNKSNPKEPSETDLLKIELAENTKDLAKKDLEIEQLQKDIADITKQLAVGGNI